MEENLWEFLKKKTSDIEKNWREGGWKGKVA